MKEESERDPAQEARDRERQERLLRADEDYGSGGQQGPEAREQVEKRRKLGGIVARSARGFDANQICLKSKTIRIENLIGSFFIGSLSLS